MNIAIRILLTLLGLTLTLLMVALVTLNEATVRVQLGVFDIPTMSLGRLMVAALGVGTLLGLLISSPFIARGVSRRRRLTRRVGELDREVHDLRTLPLRGDG